MTTIYVTESDLGDVATSADVERYIGLLREEIPADEDVRIVRGAGINDYEDGSTVDLAQKRAWNRFCGDDGVECECGEWSGEACAWSGPKGETVLVEFMPEQHRASHRAAGNRGSYPHNGSIRIRVERSCADRMVETDGEWVARV